MVHLFFWDYTLDLDSTPPHQAQRLTGQESGTPTQDVNANDAFKGYKLMFSGEVVGVSMSRSPMGRNAVLQCADFSTYWDTTYQFMITYGPHGNFLGNSAAVWAGGASTYNNIIDDHKSVMNSLLKSRPKSPGLQNVKGLMGGIISVLESMGGIRNQTHGVNDFFTVAELKNHVLQQIVAEQDDDTAQRLFDEKSFMEWLNRGLSSLGQLTTFRDMIKLLFQFVYYESVPNPCAMYVPAEEGKIKTTTTTYTFPTSVRDKLVELYNSAILKGNARFDSEGNVTEAATRNLDNTPGLFTKENPLFPDNSLIAGDVRNQLTSLAKTKSLFPKIKTPIEKAATFADSASKRNRLDSVNARKDWTSVATSIEEALIAGGVPRSERRRSSKVIKKAEVDRLQTQVFRPDCFFAAPPKCNVLFPEMYTSYNFSRNFLQEVTRLRLTSGWIFGTTADGLLASNFFAPAMKDLREVAKSQGNSGARALLPWEIYSGILPKFETCSEINYIAGASERKLGIKRSTGKAVGYAQRAANFNYFKYRFAARGCDVSMKFNPFIVCGFPAALITQPFMPSQDQINAAFLALTKKDGKNFTGQDVSDNIREVARYLGAPSHYLGMVAGVSHSVSQDGGTTSITMTHARSHRVTEDDFMSVWLKEKTVDSRKRVVSTVIDAETALKNGNYAHIRFLIDSLDQSDIKTRAQRDLDELENNADIDNSVEVGNRPTGLPDVTGQSKLAAFSLLSPELPNTTQIGSESVVVQSEVLTDSGSASLTGTLIEATLQGTRTPINVPALAGKLRPGKSVGPQGGKIFQIQCHSDSVLVVTPTELRKYAPKPKASAITSNNNTIGNFNGTVGGALAPGEVDAIPGGDIVLAESLKPKIRKKAKVFTAAQYFMWRKITIWEEKQDNTPIDALIPVEEALRPPWFSPLYSNWFIGDKIYTPFFGCGSIVDEAVFTSPNGNAVFGTSRSNQKQLLTDLESADGNTQKISEILDKAKAGSLKDVPDVESSLDALAYIYGEVRRMGLDVHKFVHDYIYRPIATLENIFGSADLAYAEAATSVAFNQRGKPKKARNPFPSSSQKLVLVEGTPGFHSTAVLAPPFNKDLLGLVDNPDQGLPRGHAKGGVFTIAKNLDPRAGRRAMVDAYATSLELGSGKLGVGLLG